MMTVLEKMQVDSVVELVCLLAGANPTHGIEHIRLCSSAIESSPPDRGLEWRLLRCHGKRSPMRYGCLGALLLIVAVLSARQIARL